MKPNKPMTNYALFSDGCGAPDFTWTIAGIKEKLDRPDTFSEQSPESFHFAGRSQVGTRLEITMDPASRTVATRLHLFTRGQLPEVPLIPAVYYVLKDLSGGKGPTQHVVRSAHTAFGRIFNRSMTFSSQFHYSWLTSPLYNPDDSVQVEVYVEPIASMRSVASHDGTLSWTIEGWAKRMEAQVKGFLEFKESPYFYARSIRCQARLSVIDGPKGGQVASTGKKIVVTIVFLTGVFDEVRCYSMLFPHRTCVTLRNPNSHEDSMSKTVDKNVADEYDVVFSNVQLDALIEDDRLLVEVSVQPICGTIAEQSSDSSDSSEGSDSSDS